jgi:hypothetical protein
VVLKPKCDALCTGVLAGGRHGFHHPVDSILDSSAVRQLAGENPQMRSAEFIGDVNPLLDLVQGVGASTISMRG